MNPDDYPTDEERDVDALTNSSLDHPAGTGMGAAGGALVGAAAGSVAGPVGTAIGAVAGAVAGGALGHATAATISPTEEELYWSENHPSQTYAAEDDDFEDFRPAYRLGAQGPDRYNVGFEAAESSLRTDWATANQGSHSRMVSRTARRSRGMGPGGPTLEPVVRLVHRRRGGRLE